MLTNIIDEKNNDSAHNAPRVTVRKEAPENRSLRAIIG